MSIADSYRVVIQVDHAARIAYARAVRAVTRWDHCDATPRNADATPRKTWFHSQGKAGIFLRNNGFSRTQRV